MKTLLKNIILFIVFGAIYFGLECLYKGHITHWSMFVLAGMVGVLIGEINEIINWNTPFWIQCGIGAIIATIGEVITGIIVNILLGLNVWHYSILAFFWSQCSLPFCCIWFILSGVCILIDDWLRWKWFGEEKPHYIWR